MGSLPQDITNPYSTSTFTLPLRPRPDGGSASSGGGHYQTLIQQVSSLVIDDYETPQGDRHVETRRQEQRVVQTTTTTTTTATTSRTAVTKQPRDRFPNPVSVSDIIGPRSSIHNCSSASCSTFSNAAASTATRARTSRHSKPSSSISISEVSSESGTGGAGASPSLKYLRTRRGAMSGPSCPGPGPLSSAPGPGSESNSSWCSLGNPGPRGYRAVDGQQLLLPAPSSRASGSFASGPGSGSIMSSDITGSRAGSTTTATTTNRLNQARLLPSPRRGWPDHNYNHNRTSSQIITDPAAFSISSSSSISDASSSSKSTVRPTNMYTSPPPPPPSQASSRISSSRPSSHNPRAGTGEITPEDSISQIGIGSSTSASAPTARRHGGQRSSLSLPIRSLPLRGVRHVSASEVGISPHVRPQQEDRWILPSSTQGRFGPPPPSEFGAGSSRASSRDYH